MNKPYEARGAAVTLADVHKSYRVGSVVTPVLRGIDLEIPGDGLSVLSGPSGSGKTTLLNLIGCIDRPDQGCLTVLGREVGALADAVLSDFRRQRIGFVFQNFNLLPVLTAFENVEYPLHLAKVTAAQRKRMVEAALDQVGLSEHRHKYPNQLSGGQRQRVAIARALVKSPLLVIADEPTGNLDSATAAQIVDLLRELAHERGAAVVVATHDDRMTDHCDRIVRLVDGQLGGALQ
jgi:putative ABC transport system ATP-binding protein